ncbi:hypothetical protein FIBSPDRAFT_1043545 [Athelia psychrophila]|uniref:Uncharacterized protein n=1 Tax=Athelia psychrophila TaxID=1759441 RepID=A0A166L0Z5_9AGAM|nr:hypothetical protein FIBSPDRAFT_1043545 [Fibularhizoctonia sp. CBS 109695]
MSGLRLARVKLWLIKGVVWFLMRYDALACQLLQPLHSICYTTHPKHLADHLCVRHVVRGEARVVTGGGLTDADTGEGPRQFGEHAAAHSVVVACILLSVTNEVLVVGRSTRLSPTSVSSTPVFPIEYAKRSFSLVASTANSHLFFFRVRAGFAHSRMTQALFCFLLVIAVSPVSQFHQYPIHCDTRSPHSLLSNCAVFLNDTGVCLFISSNSAVLSRISRALLRSGLLYYGCVSCPFPSSRRLALIPFRPITQTDLVPPRSLTIGFRIASTIHVFLGLLYAEFVGMISVGLSSALACCVFRIWRP